MAQLGKKNLALFQSLRQEMAANAKVAGQPDVPNLQESMVEVHVHGKKNLALFQSLRQEMAANAKVAGQPDVPNLQESMVEVHVHGHMTQLGKKNLALFQSLRKEMAAKAKVAGKTDVPNLQESMVEVHVHGGTKRKAELPPRHDKGKDVKRVRAALLRMGSASGARPYCEDDGGV
ncbi:hypothetical protein DEO72_LG2g3774 [Vigna unguiculata]|uniref:Uncharacterized protein n=1 Tax=Vigna unguiculata TaxID=3917 RepID=A0A4D6L4M7_VIGUN|nr:hypothetical protein DEO72_LG2g3774 [Vigna unguiculata]